jgi:hypothetical protein
MSGFDRQSAEMAERLRRNATELEARAEKCREIAGRAIEPAIAGELLVFADELEDQAERMKAAAGSIDLTP